ncbi:MAG: hypothetical protein L0338_39845 [Acidobacteria bacterium]|nr:hypothetical protein [Acidobacteriota bacterium]
MRNDFKDFERQIRRMLRRRDIDASTVLHRLGHMACSLAMSGAEDYLRAARLQMRRIDTAVKARSPGARVFREIHFYMICWDAIWKRLELIKDTAGLRPLKQVMQQYRVEAAHYVLGRNELEHYVNWLRGRPKVKPLAAWDHGNLAGRTFMLAGRQWDVSRASLKRLDRLLRDFRVTVKTAGEAQLHARQTRGRPDAGSTSN